MGKHLARVDGVIGDESAKVYYYHTDQVGSVKAVTDAAGTKVYDVDYLPFGNRFTKDGEFDESHGFTGKELDGDTGLYYYNVRWYDSETGRFISKDPMADPNNPNLYSYCGNNPLNRIDPSGLDSIVIEDIENVGGMGHVLMLVQETKDGKFTDTWTLYSTTGKDDPTTLVEYGISDKIVQDKDELFNKLTELDAIATVNIDNLETQQVEQTVKQTEKTREYWETNKDNSYFVAMKNCANQVYNSLLAGGVKEAVAALQTAVKGAVLIPNVAFKAFQAALKVTELAKRIFSKKEDTKIDNSKKQQEEAQKKTNQTNNSKTTNSTTGSSGSGGSGGTNSGGKKIICAELFRQGLMDKTIYEADEAFGEMLYKKYPTVLVGYYSWAKPVVRYMKESKTFTHFVYTVAKPWSYEMAHVMGKKGKGDLLGKVIMYVGFVLCLLIGMIATNVFCINYLLLLLVGIVILMRWNKCVKNKNLRYKQIVQNNV